jgi:hypothetical protein
LQLQRQHLLFVLDLGNTRTVKNRRQGSTSWRPVLLNNGKADCKSNAGTEVPKYEKKLRKLAFSDEIG